MGNGGKHSDAIADKWRDRFRRDNRALRRARRQLESLPDDEVSEVTRPDVRVPSSAPAPLRGLFAILTLLPPWGRVLVVLAIIGAAAAGGHTLGWW